jgi:hypothetical protein
MKKANVGIVSENNLKMTGDMRRTNMNPSFGEMMFGDQMTRAIHSIEKRALLEVEALNQLVFAFRKYRHASEKLLDAKRIDGEVTAEVISDFEDIIQEANEDMKYWNCMN